MSIPVPAQHSGHSRRGLPNTCQEDKEQSQTVKEDELEKEDDAEESFAVAFEAVIHEKVEHGVAVDADEADGEGHDIVEVVKCEEVARVLVADDEEQDVHREDEELVGQEDVGHEGHKGEPGRRDDSGEDKDD